tara:strand:+ start:576 stop:752 length:177 start_codon:yes stop_codon:yes gene_type:complete
MEDIITVAERIYYEANKGTNMDVPSCAYERVEELYHAWVKSSQNLSLYDFCKSQMSNN